MKKSVEVESRRIGGTGLVVGLGVGQGVGEGAPCPVQAHSCACARASRFEWCKVKRYAKRGASQLASCKWDVWDEYVLRQVENLKYF